jgi:hypothetical protein
MKLGAVATIGPTTAHTKSRRPSAASKLAFVLSNPSLLGADIKAVVVVSLPIATRSTALSNIPMSPRPVISGARQGVII